MVFGWRSAANSDHWGAANDRLDPGETKAAAKAAPYFAGAAEQFLAEHGPKLKVRAREDYKRLIEAGLKPAFGRRRLADISVSDVAAFHIKLVKNRAPRIMA